MADSELPLLLVKVLSSSPQHSSRQVVLRVCTHFSSESVPGDSFAARTIFWHRVESVASLRKLLSSRGFATLLLSHLARLENPGASSSPTFRSAAREADSSLSDDKPAKVH